MKVGGAFRLLALCAEGGCSVTFNRRILLQVTLPAMVIGSLLLGACIVSLRSLHQLQRNRSEILSSDVASLLAAQELESELRQLRFHSLIDFMDPKHARQEDLVRDQQQFEAALQRAKKAASQKKDPQLLREIEVGYQRYREELATTAGKLPPQPTVKQLLDWVDEHPLSDVIHPCEKLLRNHQAAMEKTTEDSEQVVAYTRWLLILLAILGPLSGLAWGFGVAWGLSRSITRLSVRLQDVHAHLDQELGSVRLFAEGDLGHLDRQMETILQRVREVVARLQEQEREILRAEQLSAVGQLAAGVAHEIRNPLSSIKLLVSAALSSRDQALRRTALPSRPDGEAEARLRAGAQLAQGEPSYQSLTPEDLRVIHDEVERLERKVQDLLDFAKPTTAHKETLELGSLIQQALNLVQTRIRQQNVAVRLTGLDRPVTISVDRDQFLSVLVNLFLNALDAMPQGGELLVRLEQQPDGAIRLDVADTGPGIDPAVVNRLFTPFTSTKPTGTGLGLSVCRRVVEDYQGRLTASNRPEGGARLTITLPGPTAEGVHANDPARG